MLIIVGLAVMAGAMAQRISGMGFALVVAPVLVLLIGPFEGILMVNICGAISALMVITRVWRMIDWKQYIVLVIPAVIAVIPGSMIAVSVSGPTLQITVGVILIVALSISLLVKTAAVRIARGPAAALGGAASGFMSATAGTSGPALTIYAVLTRWEHARFAATAQPYFVTLGTAAFLSKIIASNNSVPDYDLWLWATVVGCTVVGLLMSELVARHVSPKIARTSVIVIAFAGATLAVVDGLFAL